MSEDDAEGGLSPAANPWLIGHVRAERRILEALRSGRMHHAWLISGPAGIGKATLAYRFARFMLAHPGAVPEDADSLHVDEDHPVFRTVAAGSHPDLVTCTRTPDPRTGRMRAMISVDEARAVSRFLTHTAAEGGWRIAVVDAADDLNAAAANAILKILEEPPARCLFLLVSHSPGRLLPTIRSRCIHLPLRPLSVAQVREALALVRGADGGDMEDLETAAALSGGSPGRALALSGSRAAELFTRFRDAASAPSGPLDRAVVLPLAEALSGVRNRDDFRLFMDLLIEWMHGNALELARAGHAREAGRWADLAGEALSAAGRAEALNLDRRQVLSELIGRIERLPRPVAAGRA